MGVSGFLDVYPEEFKDIKQLDYKVLRRHCVHCGENIGMFFLSDEYSVDQWCKQHKCKTKR